MKERRSERDIEGDGERWREWDREKSTMDVYAGGRERSTMDVYAAVNVCALWIVVFHLIRGHEQVIRDIHNAVYRTMWIKPASLYTAVLRWRFTAIWYYVQIV